MRRRTAGLALVLVGCAPAEVEFNRLSTRDQKNCLERCAGLTVGTDERGCPSLALVNCR